MYKKYMYDFGYSYYPIKNKEQNITDFVRYMLNRTSQMFKYTGLPDTIPKRNLELMLQQNGFVCVTKVDGKLYAFFGGLGGIRDAYYMPTICTVANPFLNFSKNLEIDKDCVIIPNDSTYTGLAPLLTKYGTMLCENDISMHMEHHTGI